MDNIILNAVITATSNKEGEFARSAEKPTKTMYFTPSTPDDKKKALDFGLSEYTSQTKNDPPFFCCKCAANLAIYTDKSDVDPSQVISTLLSEKGANFKSNEPVVLNIIKGENKGNTFFRVQAILAEKPLETVKATNPFA